MSGTKCKECPHDKHRQVLVCAECMEEEWNGGNPEPEVPVVFKSGKAEISLYTEGDMMLSFGNGHPLEGRREIKNFISWLKVNM